MIATVVAVICAVGILTLMSRIHRQDMVDARNSNGHDLDCPCWYCEHGVQVEDTDHR